MDPQDRDPREKLEPFRRHWVMMALIVLAISAATYYYYSGRPAKYAATTSVFVRSAGPTPVVGTDPETDPARRLANQAQLLQTPAVAEKVAHQLGYKGSPRDLLSLITVTPSSTSDFVSITATTSNPGRSAALANGFADAFAALSDAQTRTALASAEANVQSQLAQLRPTVQNATLRDSLQTQLQNLQLSRATPPNVERVDSATVPSTGSATPTRNALFAAILGLVLAVLLVQGLEAFNRRLRYPMVEAEYGLPLLASIPFSRRVQSATRSGSRIPVAMMERVRGLRTMLEHGAGSGAAPRAVLVTSAIPGEGKSTLVKSLALSYFESARSVLVIDADLRRPMLHEFFEAPLVPGLSDVLRSAISLPDAVQEVRPGDIEPAFDPVLAGSESALAIVPERPGKLAETRRRPPRDGNVVRSPVLHLLASGSGTSDPAALLGSGTFAALLAEAAATYDVVVIDSPPVLAVSDAIPVATAVEAVVVVARSEFTTREAAQRCRRALERVPRVKVLGVVANGVREEDGIARPYYSAAS